MAFIERKQLYKKLEEKKKNQLKVSGKNRKSKSNKK